MAMRARLGVKLITKNGRRGKKAVIGGILLIAVGVAGAVFGLLADEFYPAFIRRPAPAEKPLPKWLGRIIFVAVGVWFIYSGIVHLPRQ